MSNINNEINNLSIEQLKMAVDLQNNGVIKDICSALENQQELIFNLHNRLLATEKANAQLTNILKKIVAKIEILNQFVNNIETMLNTVQDEDENKKEEDNEEIE